jgi:prephenate dehydrogenase
MLFSRISILGCGLLGGSLGLTVRTRGIADTVVGLARREETLRKAVEVGAADITTPHVAEAVAGSQLIVLAAPVGAFPKLMAQVAESADRGALVTDVGSTKRQVVRWAEKLLPKSLNFVGSHPMAGSEKTGVEFARDDLFEGATVIITPISRTSKTAAAKIKRFWTMLGCRATTMSPAAHDRALARVSHLPHALASCLANAALASRNGEVAGPGFRDTSRVASGDPDMWRDIFVSNRSATVDAMDVFIDELTRLREAIYRSDEREIHRILARAKRKRDKWLAEDLKSRGVDK